KALLIHLVAQIFGSERPMAAEHIFDATAAGPSPVKILFATENTFTRIRNLRLVIYPDTAAGPVKQPVTERKTEPSTDCGKEIAVASTGVRAERRVIRPRFDSVPLQVHVTAFGFDTEHQPIPLEVVTDLTAGNEARLVISPLPIWKIRITIDIVIFAL